MRLLLVNTAASEGSIGMIVSALADAAKACGHTVAVAHGIGKARKGLEQEYIRIGNRATYFREALGTRLFDAHGLVCRSETEAFLRRVEQFAPDIIHLHNIHGYYIHWPLLFRWLAAHPEVRVVWTLHDCWAFTGHCAHPLWTACEQWKSPEGCRQCPGLSQYPATRFIGRVKRNFALKKELFKALVSRITIIAPGEWIAAQIKNSFLHDISCRIIPNGVDCDLFDSAGPAPSDDSRPVILGVANGWSAVKGLDDFIALRRLIPQEEARIVLVGRMPSRRGRCFAGIEFASCGGDPSVLASMYAAADVYVCPTYAETNNLTKMEALAAGTPVVTYLAGGSAEGLDDSTVAEVVACGDVGALADAVRRMINEVRSQERTSPAAAALRQACREHARRHYDIRLMTAATVDLYSEILSASEAHDAAR